MIADELRALGGIVNLSPIVRVDRSTIIALADRVEAVERDRDEAIKQALYFKAKVAEVERDAARYRWARDDFEPEIWEFALQVYAQTPAEVDAAFDAAIKEQADATDRPSDARGFAGGMDPRGDVL